jgi:ribonucleoside-diphosphate reductase beta chain
MEDLLTENNRKSLYPLDPNYSDIWKCYKDQQACFWVAEEIDLSEDVKQWPTLGDDYQHFLKQILGFFGEADQIVEDNLNTRFLMEITVPEVKIAYSYEAMMENVHHEMYSIFIDSYIETIEEKEKMFNGSSTMPIITEKLEWAKKLIDSDCGYAERLIAWTCVEGIFFSGSFCAIDWLSDQNIMPGLTQANEFISRDEGQHVYLNCILYKNHIQNKLSVSRVKEIISEAVEIEKRFVTDALPVRMIGMNSDLMCTHIEHCANILLIDLGYDKLYPASECPFKFMTKRSLEKKTNFFEKKVTQYRKATTEQFSTDADF